MGVKIQLLEVGTYKSDFLNTRDKLVARIMNSAAVIKQERQEDLMRATRTIA